MWVMRCELTFEILPWLPNSIWLLRITLVWPVRGLVMGVGLEWVMSFDWLQGARQPGSIKPCRGCSPCAQTLTAPDDSD